MTKVAGLVTCVSAFEVCEIRILAGAYLDVGKCHGEDSTPVPSLSPLAHK